jgi:predicted nucleic acid-binding protein
LAKIFLDTNILIYALDDRVAGKHLQAAECVRDCIAEATGCLSTQVLQEFAAVSLTKLKLPEAEVLHGLEHLKSLEIVSITPTIVERGVTLTGQFQLHFWDAMILAAAEEAGCEALYSEDFQAGMTFGNLRVENPLN